MCNLRITDQPWEQAASGAQEQTRRRVPVNGGVRAGTPGSIPSWLGHMVCHLSLLGEFDSLAPLKAWSPVFT